MSFSKLLVKSDVDAKDYISVQRRYNTLHLDGSSEAFNERAMYHARSMCMLLKAKSINIIPDSVLDVGCRVGYVLRVFREEFPTAQITGVDIVPEFVDQANLSGTAQLGDAHELPFEDDSFDVTFSSQTLEHCHDVDKAVGEMLRVTDKALFLSLPLEGAKSFAANPSHYAHTRNTLGWLGPFTAYPDWQLISLSIIETNVVDYLFTKHNIGVMTGERL